MVRIAGVNIPDEKQILISLTYIYGIGRPLALKILSELNISPQKKTKDLTPEEFKKLIDKIEKNYKVEGELKKEIIENIKRLKEIRCYRGLRHIKGLPVRGQKTRKNCRTIRGNVRKTVGSGRKPPPAPK
ncbi:MAG: 30S ribosomal protein S13 [Minisyncoccia bacterium]